MSKAVRQLQPHSVELDHELTLEGEFGWAVHDVQRLMGRLFDRRMRSIGLTRAQGRVLAVLRRNDGSTQSAIADRLDMERAPVGKLVDRLEDAGFVTRRPDPEDRRVRRVYLTAKFSSIATEMLALGEEIFEPAFDGISKREMERVTEALLRIKSNLMVLDALQSEQDQVRQQRTKMRKPVGTVG